VVGHRASGWTPVFNVLYWPMRAFERGVLEEVPARPDSIVDFVPVDYVTDGILALLDEADAHGTYNLVAGERALSVGELVELHSSVTGRAPARFAPQDDSAGLPAGAETFAPYFDVRCRFNDARASELFEQTGVEKPDPGDYLGRLVAYARTTSWGKRPISRQASMDLAGAV
jgi:nucleoside-diphosphate-sugar epimerase